MMTKIHKNKTQYYNKQRDHNESPDYLNEGEDESSLEILATVMEGMLYFFQRGLAEQRFKRETVLR